MPRSRVERCLACRGEMRRVFVGILATVSRVCVKEQAHMCTVAPQGTESCRLDITYSDKLLFWCLIAARRIGRWYLALLALGVGAGRREREGTMRGTVRAFFLKPVDRG